MADPGDLGRRVTHRREELGLSGEELARRTGMAPAYIRHLETNANALPDLRAVLKLANALETTSGFLLGTGQDRPAGAAVAGSPGPVVHMSEDECWERLAAGGVGRIVFDGQHGPVALPVNFEVLPPRSVAIRTDPRGPIAALDGADPVGFEADRIDDTFSKGWSVTLSGRLSQVTDAQELERARALGVTPWAAGDRSVYMVLAAAETSGRRIGDSR